MQQTYRRTPCQSVILIKLQSNFIEIAFWQGCSANLLYIFRTPFPKNTYVGLLLSKWNLLKHLCNFWKTFLICFYHYYREYQELIRSLFMILIKWKYNVICYFLGDDDYYSGAPKCTHLKELKTTSPSKFAFNWLR